MTDETQSGDHSITDPKANVDAGFRYVAPTQAWGGNADPRNLSYLPPPEWKPTGERGMYTADIPPIEQPGIYRFDGPAGDGSAGNEHLGGVPWWEAPPPPRDHEHWAQTTGVINGSERVERCACGAIRSNVSPRWVLLDAPRVAPQSYLPPPQPPACRRSWFARHKVLTGLLAVVALLLVLGIIGAVAA